MPSLPAPATRTNAAVDLGTLVFLGAVWGAVYLFMRIAAPEVGPVWAAEIRVAIAAAILVAVAGRRTLRSARGRLATFAFTGLTFSAIPFSLIAFASLTLPAGLGAILNAATPLFTALVGAAFLGARMSGKTVIGIAVGMLAVVLVVGWSPLDDGPGTLLAAAAALGAALSYAVAGTFVHRRLPDVAGIEIATGQLVASTLILLPIAILSGAPGMPSAAGAASLVGIATISTALAWPLYFRVLGRTTATAASTVTFIVPAFAILWGALVLGEPVGPELIVGFGLIMVSLALVLGVALPTVPHLGRGQRRRVRATATAAP